MESLKGLVSLVTLTLDQCNLHRFPSFALSLPCLSSLSLYECKLDDVPTELLGKAVGPNSNCLHAVRAHFERERGQPTTTESPTKDWHLAVEVLWADTTRRNPSSR